MALRPGNFFGLLLACSLRWVSAVVANDLSPDEEVIFFPTAIPFNEQTPQTTLAVHGWIFEPETNSLSRRVALAGMAKLLGFDEQEQASVLFRERAARFLVDNERDQRLVVRLGQHDIVLPASHESGHLRAELTLLTDEVQKLVTSPGAAPATVEYQAVAPADDARTFRGRVHLIGPTGWSIVTDIDDTIKDSNVLDKAELLRNTFLREFRAVPNMAEKYRSWDESGVAFHYVSGSPWQLYPPLAEFAAKENYPLGSWHLRQLRLHDGSAAALLQPPETYKRETIEALLRAYPQRKFVLVGDTGEKDPEAYGDLARRFSAQVRFVALRNVTAESADGPRLQAALREIPPEKVLLFRTGDELPALAAIK